MRGGDEAARWATLVSGGDGDAGERVSGLSGWLAGPAGSGCGERWLGCGASGVLGRGKWHCWLGWLGLDEGRAGAGGKKKRVGRLG